MANNGKYVICHDWAPKQQTKSHTVSRALCLLAEKDSCPTCVHSQFILKIPVGAGDQTVACPRWDEESPRIKDHLPVLYSPVRRETCLRIRPFEFCTSCPNSKPDEPPRNVEGWYIDWQSGKDPYG